MATSKRKKVVSKDELRRLMKQKQTTLKQLSRIEHQYAKYNVLNQLVCTVCNLTIKSDHLWASHLQSRTHKERLAAKTLVGPSVPQTLNRVTSNSDGVEFKKPKEPKGGGDTVPNSGFSSNAKTSNALLSGYDSSSDDDSSDEETPPSKKPKPTLAPTGLPTDFFDSDPKSTENVPEEKPKTMADVLPEGFFDDPKMDAKVRKVEYRDKMDDEWDLFQRAMKEEAHVSEVIIAEDDEQANIERNIDEIDDQINRWQEIEDLHDKKAVVVGKKVCEVPANDDSDDSLDEDDLEALFDWRAKKLWK